MLFCISSLLVPERISGEQEQVKDMSMSSQIVSGSVFQGYHSIMRTIIISLKELNYQLKFKEESNFDIFLLNSCTHARTYPSSETSSLTQEQLLGSKKDRNMISIVLFITCGVCLTEQVGSHLLCPFATY